MSRMIAMLGLLGWSNKRPGLEFYRYDERTIPRHGSEWGDLLALEPELRDAEGRPLIVVALPRAASREEVVRALAVVRRSLKDEVEGGAA